MAGTLTGSCLYVGMRVRLLGGRPACLLLLLLLLRSLCSSCCFPFVEMGCGETGGVMLWC